MSETVKNSYTQLFEVRVSHKFYEDINNYESDLLFHPTPECEELLNNFHLLFRPTRHGFKILCEVLNMGVANPLLFIPMEATTKFTFTIMLNNPYFENYSQLPIENKEGNVYYFDNLNENINSGILSLSKEVGGSVSGVDKIVLMPQQFTREVNSPTQSPVQVDVKNRDNITVLSNTVEVDRHSGKGFYNANFQKLDTGIYTLIIDGNQEIFYSSSHCFTKKVFGVIEIFSPTVNTYRFIDPATQNVTPKTYALPFDARSCIWKYYFILRNNTGLDPADIVIKKDSIPLPFTSTGKEPHNEYTERIPYSSDNDLELKYGQNDYTVEVQVSASVLEEFNQPEPSYKNLKKHEGTDEVLLESFIYI